MLINYEYILINIIQTLFFVCTGIFFLSLYLSHSSITNISDRTFFSNVLQWPMRESLRILKMFDDNTKVENIDNITTERFLEEIEWQ